MFILRSRSGSYFCGMAGRNYHDGASIVTTRDRREAKRYSETEARAIAETVAAKQAKRKLHERNGLVVIPE